MSSRDHPFDRWLHGSDWITNRAAFVVKNGGVVSALLTVGWVVGALALGFALFSALEREQVWAIGVSRLLDRVGFGQLVRLTVPVEMDGQIVELKRHAAVIAASLPETWERLNARISLISWAAWVPGLLLAGGYVAWSLREGDRMGKADHLRGTRMADPDALNAELAEAEAAFAAKVREGGKEPDPALMRLQIGPINLPKDREVQGFYISGSTGSGKTVAQKSVMDQVRALDQKMIVYDPKPEFVREFFRDGDVILNPLDARGVYWEPWAEIRKLYDYRSFAESLIELDPKYASFAQSAQTVLAAMLSKAHTIEELVDALRMSTEDTEAFLVGTPAQGVISAANARGSDTVLGMIRQKLSVFNYMLPPDYGPEPGEAPFSLRDWVADHDDRRWVFLVCPEDQRPLLRPLITLWFDIVAREIMSLVPNNELPLDQRRRIWLMLEELPSLPAIPSLEGLTAKGRAYGAVWMITVQDPGQLDSIYGPDRTAAILQNCNTWLVFRANNALTAKMVSAQIGQFEEWEKHTSYSFGVGDERDGASYSEKRALRDAVLPSEIQRLPDLHCFLVLYGDYPATLIEIPYKSRPETQPGSVMRPDLAIGYAVATGEPVVQPQGEAAEEADAEPRKRRKLGDLFAEPAPVDAEPVETLERQRPAPARQAVRAADLDTIMDGLDDWGTPSDQKVASMDEPIPEVEPANAADAEDGIDDSSDMPKPALKRTLDLGL